MQLKSLLRPTVFPFLRVRPLVASTARRLAPEGPRHGNVLRGTGSSRLRGPRD